MPDFPQRMPLKVHKCPSCKDKLAAAHDPEQNVIRVLCGKNCGYSVDLLWLGDAESRKN